MKVKIKLKVKVAKFKRFIVFDNRGVVQGGLHDALLNFSSARDLLNYLRYDNQAPFYEILDLHSGRTYGVSRSVEFISSDIYKEVI